MLSHVLVISRARSILAQKPECGRGQPGRKLRGIGRRNLSRQHARRILRGNLLSECTPSPSPPMCHATSQARCLFRRHWIRAQVHFRGHLGILFGRISRRIHYSAIRFCRGPCIPPPSQFSHAQPSLARPYYQCPLASTSDDSTTAPISFLAKSGTVAVSVLLELSVL